MSYTKCDFIQGDLITAALLGRMDSTIQRLDSDLSALENISEKTTDVPNKITGWTVGKLELGNLGELTGQSDSYAYNNNLLNVSNLGSEYNFDDSKYKLLFVGYNNDTDTTPSSISEEEFIQTPAMLDLQQNYIRIILHSNDGSAIDTGKINVYTWNKTLPVKTELVSKIEALDSFKNNVASVEEIINYLGI